ncbi:hypothetical protein A9Q99_08600 [Gammaproteobacteria bacterium 45_16_T64]|nr:hypothetical protein A9Q99_08600 [Gammaproteobacteria bacterium 45_16_T64]
MKAKILIVDDEPNNHIVYERILAPLKLEFVKALSGQQALSVAHKYNFFLILMDVQMPGMDGFETASLILNHPKTSHIPIIFITAFARDESLEFRGYASGAVDFMVKPINDDVLRSKVKIFLSLFNERIQLKSALFVIQTSEERFRTLFEKSNDAIFIMDSINHHYLDANQSAIGLTGRTLIELQALNCGEIFTQDITVEFDSITPSLPTKDFGIVAVTRPDNNNRSARFNIIYLDDSTLVGIARDITDEQHMQVQLRRTQKMDAVGQLTGGIAHDFNNILGIILGNIELIQGQISEEDKIAKKIESIRKSAKRAADLTGQLLRFSGRQAITVTSIDINEVIKQMDTLVGRSVTPQIRIEHYFADDLWKTSIDSGDFEDALLNLVINAHDAMSGNGQITIETGNFHIDEGFCRLNPGATPGDYVLLAVSDTGSGIPADIQERLFEPFFTTKEEGKGTGLGLAMVYGFVERSSGYIKVYSELYIGTTFRIYLPRASEENQPIEEEPTHVNHTPTGGEVILVVDDEAALVELAGETLESLGYNVITASNGEQALEYLMGHPEIDLLFSDVVMPGRLNGYQLAEHASANDPTLSILLTSGFTSRSSVGNGQEKFKRHLLNKPYAQAEMAERIGQLLSGDLKTDTGAKGGES